MSLFRSLYAAQRLVRSLTIFFVQSEVDYLTVGFFMFSTYTVGKSYWEEKFLQKCSFPLIHK